MKYRYVILLGASLLLISGCDEGKQEGAAGEGAETAAAAVQTKEVAQPQPETTKKLMADHYEKAWEARDAIIRGNFEAAKKSVGWLAEHDQKDALPTDVRPKLEPMQAAAGRFVEAKELRAAGAAFAEMLAACGSCHAEVEGGPEFDPPAAPEGDDVTDHMQRHRWAADRMWEGIVAPDSDLYHSGAEALMGTQMKPADLPGAAKDPEKVEALAKHVHEMAGQAVDAKDEPTSIAAYGRFIASCAGCHRYIGGGPGADQPSESALVNDLLEE